MNKKYMDFVPAKPKKAAVKKTAPKKVTVVAKKPKVVEKPVVEEDVLSTGAETFSLKKEPKYGVVEEFRSKFVKTEVEKRPLSRGHFTQKKTELAAAKAKKVGLNEVAKPVEKPVEKSEKTEKSTKSAEDKAKMKIPKSPFINQAKVAKRPLSKNIYERTVKPTEEITTGPVTIISKPEKDTKVSLVVTIILTIILGAAAGTVAFLLLPK
ncbi:hypothetical protein IKF43_00140 [Candidatus Saccharibacteria bacterium]|nr:hypothetical protein [Candidatus Saccharibacteria bacterium]